MSSKPSVTPRTSTASTPRTSTASSVSKPSTRSSLSGTTKSATTSTRTAAASTTSRAATGATTPRTPATGPSSAVKKSVTSSGLSRVGSSSALPRTSSAATMSRSGGVSGARPTTTGRPSVGGATSRASAAAPIGSGSGTASVASSTPATPRTARPDDVSAPPSPRTAGPSISTFSPDASPAPALSNTKNADQIISDLRAQVSDYQNANELLKMKEKKQSTAIEQLTKQVETLTLKDPANAAAVNAAHIRSLTDENTRLQEEIEIMQLDKDQLVLDYELLEEKCMGISLEMEELKLSGGGGGSAVTSAPVETMSSTMAAMEIEKLREALSRLNTSALRDRESLAVTTKKYTDLLEEAEELRKYKIQAEESIAELRETVDESSTYESMIESLTERNLELGAQMSQCRQTIREMEEAQELMEELDGRQRAQMQLDRDEIETLMATISEYDFQISEFEQKAADHQANMDKMKAINKALRDELQKMELSRESESLDSKQLSARLREFSLLQKRHEVLLSELSALYNQCTQARTSSFKFQSQLVRMDTIFGSTAFYSEEAKRAQTEVTCASVISSGMDACRNVSDLISILTGTDRELLIRAEEKEATLSTCGLLLTMLLQCQTHAINIGLITFQGDWPEDEPLPSHAAIAEGTGVVAAASKKGGKVTQSRSEQMKFLVALGVLHSRATQYVAAIRAAAPCKTITSLDSEGGGAAEHKVADAGEVAGGEGDAAVSSTNDATLAAQDYDDDELEANSTVVENVQGCRSVILELQEAMNELVTFAKTLGPIHHPPASATEQEIGNAEGSANAGHCLHTFDLQYSAFFLESTQRVAENGSYLMGVQAEQLFIMINTLCDIGHHQTHELGAWAELADIFKSIKIDLQPLMNLAKKNTTAIAACAGDLRLAYQFLLSAFNFVNAGMSCTTNAAHLAGHVKNVKNANVCVRKIVIAMSGLDDGGSVECFRFFPSLLLTNIVMVGRLRVQDAQPQLREQYNQLVERYWSLITFGTNDLMIAQHGKSSSLQDVEWKTRAQSLAGTANERLAAPHVAASGNVLKDLPAVRAEALLIAAERNMVTKEQHQALHLDLDVKKDQLKISEHKCAEYQTIIHDLEKQMEQMKMSINANIALSYDEDDDDGVMPPGKGTSVVGSSLDVSSRDSESRSDVLQEETGSGSSDHRRKSSGVSDLDMSEFALSETNSITVSQDMAEISKRRAMRRASLGHMKSERGGKLSSAGIAAAELNEPEEGEGVHIMAHDANDNFHQHASKELLLHESLYLNSQVHFWRSMAIHRMTASLARLVDPTRNGSQGVKEATNSVSCDGAVLESVPATSDVSGRLFGDKDGSDIASSEQVDATTLYRKVRALRAANIKVHSLTAAVSTGGGATTATSNVSAQAAMRARARARSGMLVYKLSSISPQLE